MATDFAVYYFFWPVVVGASLLIAVAVASKPAAANQGVVKLGIKRISHGYLGVMAAIAVYAMADSYLISVQKIELSHISSDEFLSYLPGWSLYLFILIMPVVIFIVTVVGLPLFGLFSKYGWGSLVGVTLIAAICSLAYSVSVLAIPYNIWCDSNEVLCMTRALFGFGVPSVLVSSGFALGARLPLVKTT